MVLFCDVQIIAVGRPCQVPVRKGTSVIGYTNVVQRLMVFFAVKRSGDVPFGERCLVDYNSALFIINIVLRVRLIYVQKPAS
jgi:hypothetical protein